MTEATGTQPFQHSLYSVLVVDDDDALRGAIVWDLKRKGYQTFEAENGEVAFQKAQETKIDLVLTDIRMPICDGIQLLKRLKDRNTDLPVVMFLSGFSDLTPEEASDQGAEAVFTKPFERKSLLKAIECAILDRETRWKKSAAPTETLASATLTGHYQLSLSPHAEPQTLTFGRGGFFFPRPEGSPPLTAESEVELDLEIHSSVIDRIQGRGKVLWSRKIAQGEGQPSGAGIEILRLSQEAIAPLLKWIRATNPRAWIPRA